MGAICSKNSNHSGGHTVLSSSSTPSGGRLGGANSSAASPTSGRVGGVGGGGGTAGRGDIRSAAAEAAERRQKEVRVCDTAMCVSLSDLANKQAQDRGTHVSNPNRGKLAANANKPAKLTPEPREEPRLVVRIRLTLYGGAS